MAERTLSPMDQVTGEYEVFLSFNGDDTRKGFTNFLYHYLVDASIRTFRDNNELRIGEEISPKLLKAIKESKISIPIFSKKYASNKYCLLELAQMVECMEKKRQEIIPIFYDVDPHEVKHQSGSYESAFCQHQKNFDEMTVQGWKEAMRKVGHIKGLELKKETNGYEGELVRKVVQAVLIGLHKNYTQLPDNLVGIDDHVKAMKELLDVDSNGVRVVGIHGMGGLGKTTIAKVIYNQLCEGFEGCCFLEDVRANSERRNDVVDLQTQLLNNIKNAVGMKKVFIVLDDVDDTSQFDNLVGKCTCFGEGTRIIVTTRNKEVLDTLEAREYPQVVYGSYEPQLMNSNVSLQLFSNNAFKMDSPPKDYDELAKDVVSTAGGLPLVLVTIGSLLFGVKDKALWEEKMRKLREIPPEKVLERLRISYDALDPLQKKIFLDIACFFIGEDYINPCYMWDACGFYPRDGINALLRRSMVKVDDNKLRMHDQLRDLGRQIVYEENTEPGKRSRLWKHKDALELWERRMVTKKVEALNLDLSEDWFKDRRRDWTKESNEDWEFRSRRLVGEDFGQLRNLRFLKLGRAELDGDFNRHLSNLRWLEWDCPGNFWPSNCHLKNLVILNLSRSEVTDDWKGWSEIETAKGLKVLTLKWCLGLRRAPIFSKFTTLERLSLCCCRNLEEINPSIQDLTNLRVLDLSDCVSLRALDCSAFSSLENLSLRECTELCRLDGLEQLESLRYLDMSKCLGLGLEMLSDLSKCKKLEKIDMIWCNKIIEIQGLERLDSIEFLDMRLCNSIERLPGLSNLKMLKVLILSYCPNLREIEDLGVLESLEHLDMSGCVSIERLPDLSNLGKLKRLCLFGCKKLREVEGLGVLESLENLDLSFCNSMKELPDLSNLKNLKELRLAGLDDITEIRGLKELKSLEWLEIKYCSSIKKLSSFSNFRSLKQVDVSYCDKITEIRGLEKLKSLTELDIRGCIALGNLPDLPNTMISRDEFTGFMTQDRNSSIEMVQLLEEKHSLSGRHSSNPVAREMEQQDQCKTLYSALEEVHHKGTLIERLAILENRVLQLSIEMDDGNTSRSSSSTPLVSGHDSSVSKVSRRDNDEILTNQETEYHPPSIQEGDEESLPSLDGEVMPEEMVGYEDEVMKLVDRLTGQQKKKLEVISIVGMPGLGKTTLARKIYNHPLVEYHFHIRAWTRVSQAYQKRDLLLDILSSVTEVTDKIYEMSDGKLLELLRKRLLGHKYLIVMDDMWDNGAWDDLKRSFPNDNNGSKIMFTSRDKALHAQPNSHPFYLRFLSEKESWELLCQKVFQRKHYTGELEDIGMQITKKCEGLPLAIVLIAGILANEKTLTWWTEVSKSVSSYIVSNQEQYMDILSLSYNHLPCHLKECFLYFGAFLEDREIPVRKLIWLWVSEGFIRQSGSSRRLEDVAEDYLTDLINRSLIIGSKKGSNGGIKSCFMHDLLRELCMRKVKEENFMQQLYKYDENASPSSPSTEKPGRLCIYSAAFPHSSLMPFAPNTTSLLCFAVDVLPDFTSFICKAFKFLRVLDLSSIKVPLFPSEIVQLVELRYFSLQAEAGSPPSSISNLQYLETLIISSRSEVTLPKNTWKMVNLRHLCIKLRENKIEDPSFEEVQGNVLENLQTLSFVGPSRSWEDVWARAPCLRKLGFCGRLISESRDLRFPSLHYSFHLETLKLFNTAYYPESSRSCNPDMFPKGLKKLTLANTALAWNEMWTLGMLPNLEVLKLKLHACVGRQWETNDGGFCRLKFLKFQDLDIVQWIASSNHFPCLQHLVLHGCRVLEEIPTSLGDIPTLEMIEVRWCGESTANSAREIKKDQEDKGNDWLKIITKEERG